MGYTIATLRCLIELGCEVHLVYWDHKKLAKYDIIEIKGLKKYPRSSLSQKSLLKLSNDIQPDITLLSGWMDKDYLNVAKSLKLKNKYVICGIDNHWEMSLKNNLFKIFLKSRIFSKYFSHCLVPGSLQFEYVKRLGIKNNQIIYEGYSADTKHFQSIFNDTIESKKNHYPHNFIFLGRLSKEKGLHILIDAWNRLKTVKHDWKLTLIGNGDLRYDLEGINDLKIKDFIQPDFLKNEIQDAGCFILPSIKEPWGVVVHEFSAAGLPMIISDKVGAKSTFLINNFNGYDFKSGNSDALRDKMLKIINLSDKALYQMGTNSNSISNRISSETSAYQILSVLK